MTRYAHLLKSGFEPSTSSLQHTFLTTTLHNHLCLYMVCYYFILTVKLICWGITRPYKFIYRHEQCHHPPLKIFSILSKSSLWLLCTIQTTRYAKYILVYIKVKIMETSKYDLSYIYGILGILYSYSIREIIIIFAPLNDLK